MSQPNAYGHSADKLTLSKDLLYEVVVNFTPFHDTKMFVQNMWPIRSQVIDRKRTGLTTDRQTDRFFEGERAIFLCIICSTAAVIVVDDDGDFDDDAGEDRLGDDDEVDYGDDDNGGGGDDDDDDNGDVVAAADTTFAVDYDDDDDGE
ncbi:hypothetical protein DPMN_044735 [Dreissena polymorpha]|uniref:Uncharacterized protein n=1 Tax=Dreissena polymorpha TaxID=45954 RepID=A0A9D4D553_DREPO|nr:hypothetical protein DPMN_044735 [Dreissena polymorpha]